MPLPLVWIGAGIAALAAGNHLLKEQQKSEGIIGCYPGDDPTRVKPKDGSIVCCGIYEIFEHSGIWVDGRIVELKGNGLIRAVSPARFLDDRSGEKIYIACDQSRNPLYDATAVERAVSKIYQYSDYHVLNNNCHRFIRQCLTGEDERITRFGELNEALHRHFSSAIYWQPAKIFDPW
ncbi:hypothetical protein DRW07_08350 [Alteromonas sediminis]|uniref:LRAT domain-containing protein n=1 Tax=Alteromonas sediminis TaxID=2259342 RepID=A0A3N5YDB1_9ALTE|nr:hypothetical protein [Alteromonas sediminis]RPJ67515.1 hypothetical protein DRW07_08350 [Alteromonas sediminis]